MSLTKNASCRQSSVVNPIQSQLSELLPNYIRKLSPHWVHQVDVLTYELQKKTFTFEHSVRNSSVLLPDFLRLPLDPFAETHNSL